MLLGSLDLESIKKELNSQGISFQYSESRGHGFEISTLPQLIIAFSILGIAGGFFNVIGGDLWNVFKQAYLKISDNASDQNYKLTCQFIAIINSQPISYSWTIEDQPASKIDLATDMHSIVFAELEKDLEKMVQASTDNETFDPKIFIFDWETRKWIRQNKDIFGL